MANASSRQSWFATVQKFCPLALIMALLTIPLNLWLPQSCYGAGGDPVWTPYNVAVAGKQTARASVVDSEGNLIVVGSAATAGTDFHVVKINALGNSTAWSVSKDSAGGEDVAVAVAVDLDDNVFVTGYVSNGGTYKDIYTAKYAKADGALLWEHTYDGSGHGDDYPTAIAVDSVGFVYVGGYIKRPSTLDSFVLLKYRPNGPNGEGNPDWDITYDNGDSGNHQIYAIAVDDVHGVAVTGKSQTSSADFDCLTIKYDSDGNQLWIRDYPDTGNSRGQAVAIDGDGNVITAGYVYYSAVGKDFYVHEYASADGTTNWLDYSNSSDDEELKAIWLDDKDNVYVAGSDEVAGEGTNVYVAKYDGATGVKGWSDSYNSGGTDNDIGMHIIGDNAGELFVVGSKNAGGLDDVLALKIKRDNGNQLWLQSYDSGAVKFDSPVGAGLTGGDLLVGGTSDRWSAGSTDYDFLALKYESGALDAPSSLAATLISNTQVDLSWADNSTGEDKFVLEWRIGVDGTPSEIDILADAVSYSHTGLTADSRYYYRIKATEGVTGDTPFSNEVNVKTTVVSEAAPVLEFQHGSPSNGEDLSVSLAIGPDNHPVITGHSDDGTSFNYHTVKLDRTDLSELWTTEYDSDDMDADVAADIAVDSNNRVIVTGSSFRYDGGGKPNSNDFYTIGYPADGTVETWVGPYNGPDFGEDFAIAIAAAVDGSDEVVVAGYSRGSGSVEDIYLLKYLPDGSLDWVSAPYDAANNDQPADVVFDSAGDVLVGGYTLSGGTADYLIIKYNGSDGSQIWAKPFPGIASGDDKVVALAVDAADNVYVTGFSVNASGNRDIYTVKFAGIDGAKIWDDVKGGLGNGDDEPVGIAVDPVNGDILVAGDILVSAGERDLFLIRYDSDGNIQNGGLKILDRPGSHEDLYALTVDPSGTACLTGTTDAGGTGDVLTVKYDPAGIIIGASLYDGADGDDDTPTAIASNQYGETFVAGVTVTTAGDSDFMVFLADGEIMQSPTPFTVTQLYTNASLSWADNSLNEIGFHIERKIGSCDSGNEWIDIHTANPGETSYFNTGLSIGSTFCYRIQSLSASDESRWVEREITTAEPVAPSGLSATVQDTTDILLEWVDNTGDEDGFTLQRCQGAGCDFSSVITMDIPANSESYIDETACSGQTYSYRIKAYKINEWPTVFSNVAADKTTTSPVAATDLATDWVSEAWVELKWTDHTADETEFRIERCSGASCSPVSTLGSVLSPPGNLLHYRMDEASWNGTVDEVKDLSAAANHGRSFNGANTAVAGKYDRAGSFDGSDDYLATGLVLDQSATTSGATMAAWISPGSISDNDHFVFGTDDGGNDWSLLRNAGFWYVADGSDAGLVNTGIAVDPGVWQHMAVVFDPVGGVTLYKNGSSVWNNAAIDFDDSTAALQLGRRGSLNQDFFDGRLDEVAVFDQPLGLAAIQALHEHGLARFNDLTVAADGVYNYQVKPYKGSGCPWPALPSNVIEVIAAPPAPTNVTASLVDTGHIQLIWTDTTTTETGFRIDRCQGSGCSGFAPLTTVAPVDATSYVDVAVCADKDVAKTYNYQIAAVKDADWSSQPSTATETTIPALIVPSALSVVSVSEDTVTLEWDYPSGDLTGYRVARCDGDPTFCANSGNFGAPVEISGNPGGTQLLLHMDEAGWSNAAGEVIDGSGNSNNGTGFGDVTTTAAGKYGRGGWFDGIDDYITTTYNVDQSASSSGVTFEAWVYPNVNNNNKLQYVISTDNGGYDWSFFQYNTVWYVQYGASYVSTGISATLNTWQHIAVTFHPAAGISFYKNGVNVWNYATISTDTSAADVTIGRKGAYTDASKYFQGGIDDVAVYDRPLTETEILDRYQRHIRHSVSGLSHAAPYRFRVSAYKNHDAPGCNWESNFDQVDTATTPPPDPDGLDVTTISSTQIDLKWNDNATSETDYHLQWCQGAGCSFDPDPVNNTGTLLPEDTLSYSDMTVCPGETYKYQVRAEKSTGPAWDTNWISGQATTLAATPPANFTATALSESDIQLEWDDLTADEDNFVLERCQSAAFDCGSPALLATFPGSVLGNQLHYRMDEALWNNTVDEVVDQSQLGNHGRAYGAVTVADSKYDRGGYFDGVNDYVLTPVYLDQTMTGSGATFEVWVKPTIADSNYRHIFSTENGGTDWGLYHRNGLWYLSTGENWRSTGIAVDVDQWQHIAVVFSPGGAGIKFYKNGVATTLNAAYLGYDSSARQVYLGRYANSTSSSYHYQGYMDEVAIYNRPLTQSEIDQHFQVQIQAFGYTDTGLTPGLPYTYQIKTTKAAECAWEATATATDTTLAPPAPTDLTATAVGTGTIDLTWTDKTGSEDNYQVWRCAGDCTVSGPFTSLDETLPENTQSYSDTTVCPGETFTYQVRAVKADPDGYVTTWSDPKKFATTALLAPPDTLTATWASEVQIDLTWMDRSSDETGFEIQRCSGDPCTFAEIDASPVAAGTGTGMITFQDDQLDPNTTYAYQVRAIRPPGSCDWPTAFTNTASATTTAAAPGGLVANFVNAAQIDLSWADTAATDTSIIIERCTGSACSDGDFGQLAEVNSALRSYSDTSVCPEETYKYRLQAKGSGLHGIGTWTRRAPLSFSNFSRYGTLRIKVPYDADMRSDFGDIRFYDDDIKREVPYYIESKIDGEVAFFLLFIGENENITMYYGNPVATDIGDITPMSVVFADDFSGTVVDAGKWLTVGNNATIVQDDGLVLNDYVNYRERNAWQKALISTATFERLVDREIYYSLTIAADTAYTNEFSAGWELDQTTDVREDAQLHGFFWTNYALRTYEKNVSTGGTGSYVAETRYDVRVVLKDVGAKYYIKGGAFADWFLVQETSAHSDSPMRLGIKQHSQQAVIHSFRVLDIVDMGTTIGAEQSSAGYSFGNTWISNDYSAVAVATTPSPVAPSGLVAAAYSDSDIDLDWDDTTGGETDYEVWRCSGPACTYVKVDTIARNSELYTDSTAPASVLNTYKVRAVHSGCAAPQWPADLDSNEASDTSFAARAATDSLTATGINSQQIRLEWDDVATDEHGYEVEVLTACGEFVKIADLPANTEYYDDVMSLEKDSDYYYRVRPYRGEDMSPYSNVAKGTTLNYDVNDTTCPLPYPLP